MNEIWSSADTGASFFSSFGFFSFFSFLSSSKRLPSWNWSILSSSSLSYPVRSSMSASISCNMSRRFFSSFSDRSEVLLSAIIRAFARSSSMSMIWHCISFQPRATAASYVPLPQRISFVALRTTNGLV